MSISDAYVDIICDKCFADERIELPFNYPDFSGKGGRYDHNEEEVMKRASKSGWVERDGQHLCESCAEDDAA